MTRLTVALRVVTAGLVGAIAGIHLDLWASHGYRSIPTIGTLFLLNGISGSLLALTCLAAPRRLLAATAASAVLFAAGTIVALVLAVNVGLFGFTESTHAPLFDQAIAVEATTILAAALLAALAAHRRRAPTPEPQIRADR
jgi:MYXO-CTERM domain-containing protein